MVNTFFNLALADDISVPTPDAPDHVLVKWLRRRLGRLPSWLEVLAFRAGIRERMRRSIGWTWWRRLWVPGPPRQEDLVAEFLRSPDGALLFALLGSRTALLTHLDQPDPWEGFAGRHPHATRPSRRETLRERIDSGCAVPIREQVSAVLAYANWKLSGLPTVPSGCIPLDAEFLAFSHAAAINSMSIEAVLGVCTRLRAMRGTNVARRELLRELTNIGNAAVQLWSDIGRRGPEAPLGIWPPSDMDGGTDAPPELTHPAPLGPKVDFAKNSSPTSFSR